MAELDKPEGEEIPPVRGRDPGLVVAEVAGFWLLGWLAAPKLQGSPLPSSLQLSPLTWACLFGFCGLCEGMAALLRPRRSSLLRWLEFLGDSLVAFAALFFLSIWLVRGAHSTRGVYQIPPALELSYTTWLGLFLGAVVCKTIGEQMEGPWERAARALFAFIIGAFTTLYLLAALESLPSFPWGPYIVVLAAAMLLAAIAGKASFKVLLPLAVVALLPAGLLTVFPTSGSEVHWRWAVHTDHLDDYRSYLEAFPEGRHAEEATERLAQASWTLAESIGSAFSYRDFLAEFPQSVYAAEAARRLAQHERADQLEDERRRLEEEQRRAAEQHITDLVEQYEQLATLEETVSQVRRQLDPGGGVQQEERKDAEGPGLPRDMAEALRRALIEIAADSRGRFALRLAAADGRSRAFAVLTGAGADPRGALVEAVEQGDVAAVAGLLKAGISIEDRYDADRTPLMIAAETGNTEMVRFLLDHGADAFATNLAGNTAFKVAVENNHREAALLLLDHAQQP